MFSLITSPLHEILVYFASTTGDLGVAIVLLTLVVRFALVPLTVPGQRQQMKNRDKIRALKPRISELKKQFKTDKLQFNKAQMDLYKEHDIQLFSWSTLLPLVQIVFLIALYSVLLGYINDNNVIDGSTIAAGNTQVSVVSQTLGINLTDSLLELRRGEGSVPIMYYALPFLAGGLQLILSGMLLPGLEHHDVIPEKPAGKGKKGKKDIQVSANEDETDIQQQAEQMSQQMLFIMPVITGFFAAQFPAGVALYWVTTTLFSLVQQYFISGLGGLTTVWNKLQQTVKRGNA